MKNKEMTKEEKLKLLKVFLEDEIYFKAITETLDDVQLDNWLEANLEQMLIKCGENY